MANRKRYIDMSDISREIYRYVSREIYRDVLYIGRNISTDYSFLNEHPSANMLRTGEDWESCTCHLVSHGIDIYKLLFHSLFKVEFDIDHFVLGEHQER